MVLPSEPTRRRLISATHVSHHVLASTTHHHHYVTCLSLMSQSLQSLSEATTCYHLDEQSMSKPATSHSLLNHHNIQCCVDKNVQSFIQHKPCICPTNVCIKSCKRFIFVSATPHRHDPYSHSFNDPGPVRFVIWTQHPDAASERSKWMAQSDVVRSRI